MVLRSLNIEEQKIKIKVNTNGCTDKNSIKATIKKSSKIDPKVPDYEITFIREKEDHCKAFLPDGATIEYDLEEDFNIKMPYTLKINNPVMALSKNDPYFMIEKIKKEVKEIKEELKEYVSIEEFSKLDLKVAQIVSAERVENAEKLLRLQIDLGGEIRQIVAGIAKVYTPEELVGKKIVVVANLKPATIRGIESRGMLLAASVGENISLLTLDKDIEAGAKVK